MWLNSDILVLDTSAREDTVMYICILCELDENALLVFCILGSGLASVAQVEWGSRI